jgi:hypothetical protein
MDLKKNILTIWKNKGQILEGIKNSVFVKEDVETIAQQRMQICNDCALLNMQGDGCMLPGTQPCCDETKGGCGCSLKLKTRSLSSSCPHPDGPKWGAVMNENEEELLRKKLGIKDE